MADESLAAWLGRLQEASFSRAGQTVRKAYRLRNDGGSLDWAAAWLRVIPQRLFSFAEHAWPGP